jgi:t-SNARE complex subunit (syntaxin)
MSLTAQDLQKIEELLDRKLDQKLDQKLGPNLERIQKMIDESHAQQFQLMLKHFVTKEEHYALVEKVDDFTRRTVNLEKTVANHSYALEVEPIPQLVQDMRNLQNEK